ncbi:MAG: CRISPR-associated endonuclease Cas1, partial [Candidatus Anstonellales archaeon]
MKKNLHIISDGTIERHENTIYFVNALEKKPLPIDQINQISCHGSVSLTSQAIHYLMQKNIPIHFFNYYGFYDGTL